MSMQDIPVAMIVIVNMVMTMMQKRVVFVNAVHDTLTSEKMHQHVQR